ncbi:WGR domain-containing protein [Bradyrhizobium sp. USDA 10063]
MLTRTDNRRNIAGLNKLDVQPTLFGGSSLVREWGRIGRAGTSAYRPILAVWPILPELDQTFGVLAQNP